MPSIMGMSEEQTALTIKTKSGNFSVMYRPNEMTPAREDIIAKLSREAATSDPLLILYCDLVAYHDLQGPVKLQPFVDENGKVYGYGEQVNDAEGNEYTVGEMIGSAEQDIPLDPFWLRQLPTGITGAVLNQIREDMSEDPKPAPNLSGIGSSRRR